MNIMDELWIVPYTVIVVVMGYDLGWRIGEIINSLRIKTKETKTEKHHEEPSDATENFMDRMDSFDRKVFEVNKDYVTRLLNNYVEEVRTENDKQRERESDSKD